MIIVILGLRSVSSYGSQASGIGRYNYPRAIFDEGR